MSKYTTQLRFICEELSRMGHSVGYKDVDAVIQEARPKIFSFDYPIFDEAYKPVLETKILRHYYTREIAAETVGLWQFWLQNKMNEIMPYYNQLYQSELLTFNPLYDTDLTTTNQGQKGATTAQSGNTSDQNTTTRTGSGTTTGTQSATNYDLYSDTPQGGLSGVEDEKYLTNARKTTGSGTSSETRQDTDQTTSTGTGTSTNNSTTNTTEQYTLRVLGKTGGASYAKMLKEFRETFLNIDLELIIDLSPLFFNLW